MVHCPAAVCAIYPVWQLPALYQSLTKLVYWFFTYDHDQYVRWVSVHLRDMMTLSPLHPYMQAEFLKGHFIVNKTTHMFSNLAIDQTHDQHNAVVKDDGGDVGLTECSATPKRWMFRDQR